MIKRSRTISYLLIVRPIIELQVIMRYVTRRCSFSANEDTKERCGRGWHERHTWVCYRRLTEFYLMDIWLSCCCHLVMQVAISPFRCEPSRQRLLPNRSRQLQYPRTVRMPGRCQESCASSCDSYR